MLALHGWGASLRTAASMAGDGAFTGSDAVVHATSGMTTTTDAAMVPSDRGTAFSGMKSSTPYPSSKHLITSRSCSRV